MAYERFRYQNIDEIRARAKELGVTFPYSESLFPLSQPIRINHMNLPNRIVTQPMEGCDANPDGSPGEYTMRRYRRFAESGASLIWTEANAVSPACRSSNGQLYMDEANVDSFARMIEMIKEHTLKIKGFEPMVIVQATHSGRYVKTNNVPTPVIAQHNEWIEKNNPLPDECIISDDELKVYEERFGKFAVLAKRAGFDGMDIKCSHFYLASELLSAYNRPGEYGGCFDNRTRFIRNSLKAASCETDQSFFVTTRLNGYDGFPYPWGFGVNENDGLEPDYTEVNKLIGILKDEVHIPVINITLGNPYVNPYVNRPYDNGPVEPQEHQFIGVNRMIMAANAVKKAHSDLVVIGSGMSYMRDLIANIAAGCIKNGMFDMVGVGRLALAEKNFASKMMNGTLARNECCVTCTSCSYLMRAFYPAGCVVRDKEIYAESFKQMRKNTK